MSTALRVDNRRSLPAWLFTSDPDTLMMSRNPIETAYLQSQIASPIVWVAQVPLTRNEMDVRALLDVIVGITGWSSREVATALGTSHTTVQKVRQGRPIDSVRSPGLEDRILDAHAAIVRLNELAHGDRSRLVAILGLRHPEAGIAAVDHLAEGRAAEAYLLALDHLREREQGKLLVGRRPAPKTGATVSLVD